MELVNNRYRIIKNIMQNRLISSYLVADMMNDFNEIQLNILNAEFMPDALIEYYSSEFIELSNIKNDSILRNYNFNIVSFIDNKRVQTEQYFYTCEYFEKNADIHELTKGMELGDILDFFMKICGAVNYLHLKGFIYGEINLNNILLLQKGNNYSIKLRDIASVELEKYYFKTDRVDGSQFKAPRLLSGEKPTVETDIYSLGVVLLNLLRSFNESHFDVHMELETLKEWISCESSISDNDYDFYCKLLPVLEKMLSEHGTYPYKRLSELFEEINISFGKDFQSYIKEEIEKLNFHSKIVGREQEIKNIIKSYDYMVKYKPVKKLFLIHGGAGSGKTRFLEEIKYLLELKRANVYSSFTISNMSDSSNKMWIEILRKLIVETDPETIEKYESELAKFFPEIVDRKNVNPSDFLNREKAKYRLLNRIAGFISDSIKSKPTVLIIDNIHLANEFTIDTIAYLYNEIIKNKNIIMIFSYKDGESFNNKKFTDFISNIRDKRESEDILMRDLTSEQTAVMVRNMLSMSYAPFKLAERIYSQSYGNPLFVSEIIKDLFSRKIIYVNNSTGRWFSDYDASDDYQYLPMPNSMEQAILSQIKDSDEIGHEILKIISVFSNSVSIEDLSDFIKLDAKEIEKSVKELVVRGVLCRKIGDKSYVYDINNKVLKDIVYDKIAYEEKIEKHRLAAEILEQDHSNSFGGNIDELIHHLEKAGVGEKVIKYSIENANRMEVLRNRNAAINNLEKALLVMGKNNYLERVRLLIRIGDLNLDDANIPKALECFISANKLSKNLGDKKIIIDTYINIAMTYFEKNDMNNVQKYTCEIDKILEEIDYREGSLENQYLKALVYINKQNNDIVIEGCNKIIEGCKEELPRLKGDAYRLLGNAFMQTGRVEESIEVYNKAIKCYEVANNVKQTLKALNNIGVIYADFYQDYEVALSYFIKVKDLSEENNYFVSEALALTNIAELYYSKFNYETAYSYFKEALAKSIKIDSEKSIFYCYNVLSRVSIDLNYYNDAYEYHMLSNKELENYPYQGRDIGEYYRCSAELFYALGEFDTAEEFIKKAIEFYSNEESIISLFAAVQLQYVNIRSSKDNKYHDFIDQVINASHKFVTPENRLIVLCKAVILLFENGQEEEARKLLEEAGKSAIGPIPDIVNAIHLYCIGLLSNGKDQLKALLSGLEISKRIKNKQLIQFISSAIGDYYFKENSYYYAANYYIEASEVIKELVAQVPNEFKLNFMNSNNMAKPFRRIEYIKNRYIKYVDKGNNDLHKEFDSFHIKNREELEEILEFDAVDEFLGNKDFIQLIRQLYVSILPKGILNEKDIITNLCSDTIKNIELIIKYLAGITLATKGVIVVEGLHHELNVIASVNDNFDLQSNKYIFERVKATMEPVLIVEKINKHEMDYNLLPEDIKACLCVPIISRSNADDNLQETERVKTPSSRLNVNGYLYLESDRILNNFNQNGLQKCLELAGFLNLLIEKHQLKIAASIDKLTGALTRKYLEDTLTEEMEKSIGYGDSLSIIMYDLDRFKSVNDRFGHQTGDEVLKKVSKLVKENIGRNDYLGRYGGEEFIIILPGTESEDAVLVAEELRKKIHSEKILGDKADVTVSMGIASCPIHGQWKHELIEKADQALYIAKENGRNRCQLWSNEFSNKIKGTNKLNGIISGNTVQDSRNVLVLVEIIQLINKSISKQEKIYSLLGRIIEIIEAQFGMLLIIENGDVVKEYGRKSLDEDWAKTITYNKSAIQSVMNNKQGLYMIDWDDIGSHDIITGVPDWYSILVVPIIIQDEIKGVIYLSTPTRIKEFGFNEFNFVNVISDLAATII